jgi:CheY-like chemotaxis protein
VPSEKPPGAAILVIADDIEVREGVEALLVADGYRICPVRNEADAIGAARRELPDLILVSLDASGDAVAASALRVRAGAALAGSIPIVMFCIRTVEEGAEVAVGENLYATWPADFNQLRALLSRLLGPVN